MGALAPPRGGEWLLDLLVTLMLLKLLTLKRLRLLPLKKEKPLQPGHRLLQNLVLIGAGGLPLQLFCIMSNSSPDSRLGIGFWWALEGVDVYIYLNMVRVGRQRRKRGK